MNFGRSLTELSDLKGRVALVVGGAGNIGRVAAAGLAERGASVVIADISINRANDVAQELSRIYDIEAIAIEVNLEDGGEVRALPNKVLNELGGINILIHLAAIVDPEMGGWTCKFEEQSTDLWRRGLEINLSSAFILAQECTKPLLASGHGTMIFFGSTYGIVGPDWSIYEGTNMGNSAAYAASKGGLIQLTKWLATTLAPQIRVNSISPGGVFRDHLEVFSNAYSRKTPLARMASEEDFKGAVAFLASDLSAYMTGHNLVVDGGWTAW